MAVSIFGATQVNAPKRNVFDLSHSVKTTTEAGYLKPVACIPIVPGDSFDITADIFCRLAPLATPALANMDVKLESFYVANRTLWPNWEKFIVFERRPDNDPKPALPTVNLRTWKTMQDSDGYNRVGVNSLADHLGIPVTQLNFEEGNADMIVSALPFAAYQKIWLDYYCDKNIQQQLIDEYYHTNGELQDGDNSNYYYNLATMHHRMYRKDYFTSALPDAQRGADVLIPVHDGNVDIRFTGMDPATGQVFQSDQVYKTDGDPLSAAVNQPLRSGTAGELIGGQQSSGYEGVTIDNSANLKGNVTSLNATITDLRTAMATQRLLELSMRVGSRIKEQLLGIFGVKSSDSRLDRAEFLGSTSVPIQIGEVAQTSETTAQSPQGNMAGRGLASGLANFKRSYFEEHGYLIIMMSVVPRSSYFQGMPRHFKNLQYTDFFWPMFEHIGEQAIRNEEIYFGTDNSNNNGTFGYAPRYSDYKWLPSTVHGEFREGSLLRMHAARYFANRPRLNQDFLNIRGSHVDRLFAYEASDYDHFWLDIYFKIKAKRPLDYFGSPR